MNIISFEVEVFKLNIYASLGYSERIRRIQDVLNATQTFESLCKRQKVKIARILKLISMFDLYHHHMAENIL